MTKYYRANFYGISSYSGKLRANHDEIVKTVTARAKADNLSVEIVRDILTVRGSRSAVRLHKVFAGWNLSGQYPCADYLVEIDPDYSPEQIPYVIRRSDDQWLAKYLSTEYSDLDKYISADEALRLMALAVERGDRWTCNRDYAPDNNGNYQIAGVSYCRYETSFHRTLAVQRLRSWQNIYAVSIDGQRICVQCYSHDRYRQERRWHDSTGKASKSLTVNRISDDTEPAPDQPKYCDICHKLTGSVSDLWYQEQIRPLLPERYRDSEIVNAGDLSWHRQIHVISLGLSLGPYAIYAVLSDNDDLCAIFDVLGSYCDDHAPGFILSEDDLRDRETGEPDNIDYDGVYFVNGSMDCALDTSEANILAVINIPVSVLREPADTDPIYTSKSVSDAQ